MVNWPDAHGQLTTAWRGKVYHVPNGAWRYFRDWETLAAYREFVIAADKSGI